MTQPTTLYCRFGKTDRSILRDSAVIKALGLQPWEPGFRSRPGQAPVASMNSPHLSQLLPPPQASGLGDPLYRMAKCPIRSDYNIQMVGHTTEIWRNQSEITLPHNQPIIGLTRALLTTSFSSTVRCRISLVSSSTCLKSSAVRVPSFFTSSRSLTVVLWVVRREACSRSLLLSLSSVSPCSFVNAALVSDCFCDRRIKKIHDNRKQLCMEMLGSRWVIFY